MIGIIGSGFGLYGYLPALIKYGLDNVALLERYKAKFLARPELSPYGKNITWVKDEDSLISAVHGIIISVNPATQADLIKACLTKPNIKMLCLEKPLGTSPQYSGELLKQLIDSRKRFRIGYTFRYTDWSEEILPGISQNSVSRIEIDWHFQAHHYKNRLNNWKRYHQNGGSVIRFYGVHLIAWSSWVGYNKVLHSESFGFSEYDIYQWGVSFLNNQNSLMKINVNCNSDKHYFCVKVFGEKNSTSNRAFEIMKKDPFVDKDDEIQTEDPRIGILASVLESLMDEGNDHIYYNNYDECNRLWADVERINVNQLGADPETKE